MAEDKRNRFGTSEIILRLNNEKRKKPMISCVLHRSLPTITIFIFIQENLLCKQT